MPDQAILIAPLGGKPQLITFLLDLLLARGEAIGQVRPIYLTQYRRSQEAYARLVGEFANDRYGGLPCQLRGVPIRTGSDEFADVRTAEEVEIVRQRIQLLLAQSKEEGHRIHLGLSGGRRLLSFVALTAAMQVLTPADHIWHVYASPELIEQAGDGRLLHAPPGSDLRLIPVPFVPWVSYFPGLSSLLNRSVQEIGESSLGWLDGVERERCNRVWEALTARQRDVLQAIAAGLTRKEAAQRLGIAVTTVDSHRDAILEQCRLIWDAETKAILDTKFLARYFSRFLAGRE